MCTTYFYSNRRKRVEPMTAPRGIGDQVRKLKEEGLSYSQICKELNCSKGTVSYHVGKGVKDRYKEYATTSRTQKCISRKIDGFNKRQQKYPSFPYNSKIRKRIVTKIRDFSRRKEVAQFTYEELMNKIGDEPKCYLTGDPIDITKTRSWNLDHIVPVAKGGDNSLENCNIATRDANLSKTDMSVDDFTDLCKKVLETQGYSVSKQRESDSN